MQLGQTPNPKPFDFQAAMSDWGIQHPSQQSQAAQFPHENYSHPATPPAQQTQQPGQSAPDTIGYSRVSLPTPTGGFQPAGGQPGGMQPGNSGSGGQWQPYGDSPMAPNVQTSITPTGVYTPQQTQEKVNQARTSISNETNLRQLLHGTDMPGVSRGAGSLEAIMPKIAAGRGQSAYAQQAIPFQDAQANAQQMMHGQQAQGQEWLGLAGASNQMNQQALGNQFNNQQYLLNLLAGLGLFG